MRLPSFFLPSFGLALLSITVTADVFSSVQGPFILQAQESFNIILRFHEDIKAYIPVISKTKIRLPEFNLTNGHLNTIDQKQKAFYAPVPLIFPPPLTPLRFGANPNSKLLADLVAVNRTNDAGKEYLKLFALTGPLVVRHLSEGQSVYIKPEHNIDPVERLKLEIVTVKSSSEAADYERFYEGQEKLYYSDLK